MTTLLEYIDYHASRLTAPRSIRRVQNLHGLYNLACQLALIQGMRRDGYTYESGRWVKK